MTVSLPLRIKNSSCFPPVYEQSAVQVVFSRSLRLTSVLFWPLTIREPIAVSPTTLRSVPFILGLYDNSAAPLPPLVAIQTTLPMTLGLIFLCLSLLLLAYLLQLVAAKHLGWVFWEPSIIWHVLNFSSLSSHYSTTSVPLLQIVQILGPSPNTYILHISMLPLCPFHSLLPGTLFLLSPVETLSAV